MKKIKLSVLTLVGILATNFASGQQLKFNFANPQPNIIKLYEGNFAGGDIDGDGDLDLFITGQGSGIHTKLYLNDGSGEFTELPTILANVTGGAIILRDLDNDNDLDVFLAGNKSGLKFCGVYLNDGFGSFTLLENPQIPQFNDGNAAIADVNNDGFEDIIIAAKIGVNGATPILSTDIYLNNGNAVFTAQQSNIFTPVNNSVVTFIDIENDGDSDVIISGKNINGNPVFELFTNNGQGEFTLNTNSTLTQLLASDIDVTDTDGDGDLDFITSGMDGLTPMTILYTNNGFGIFSITPTNIQHTIGGKNAFGDLDNDGDEDLLSIGSRNGGFPNMFNIVYQNDGNNVFVPSDTLGGDYIGNCILDDFNGDGLKDAIIQGLREKTSVYWNIPLATSAGELSIKPLQFSGFPNPTNGLINLNINNSDYSNLNLVDVHGKILETIILNNNEQNVSLNLSIYPDGIYFIQLINNQTINNIKVIKQK